jgi:hypothetical protein
MVERPNEGRYTKESKKEVSTHTPKALNGGDKNGEGFTVGKPKLMGDNDDHTVNEQFFGGSIKSDHFRKVACFQSFPLYAFLYLVHCLN